MKTSITAHQKVATGSAPGREQALDRLQDYYQHTAALAHARQLGQTRHGSRSAMEQLFCRLGSHTGYDIDPYATAAPSDSDLDSAAGLLNDLSATT
jgi:hypothetical protein